MKVFLRTALRRVSTERWSAAITAVLIAVFLAIGWIQLHQSKLADRTTHYAEENISWIFMQIEQEFVALRDSLREAQRYPQKINTKALRQDYEVFVSRILIVQSVQIDPVAAPLPKHADTLGLITQFVERADPMLSEQSAIALQPDMIDRLLRDLEPLVEPIHDMSLLTIEFMDDAVNQRNAAAREQVLVSIALTVFQGLLTMIFAALLIRKVRSLEKRSHELGLARDEILRLNDGLEERVRRRTLQLETANQELLAFSYSISHDLRAPLNTIDGFGHLLERLLAGPSSEKGQHYLGRIRNSVQRMGELIDGLLALAQLSRDSLHVGPADLAAIARQLAQECRESDPSRQAQIQIQHEMRVTGDGRLLRVVMQNLLSNAWKFTANCKLTQIEVGSQAGEAGSTVYFVKDNGAGFNMAYAHKLFGTFERLHSPADFAGTGIGLATVKRVIHRHGGRIWAEGKEGEGAVFFFTLGTSGAPAEQPGPQKAHGLHRHGAALEPHS